jgi:hypothetical protein
LVVALAALPLVAVAAVEAAVLAALAASATMAVLTVLLGVWLQVEVEAVVLADILPVALVQLWALAELAELPVLVLVAEAEAAAVLVVLVVAATLLLQQFIPAKLAEEVGLL